MAKTSYIDLTPELEETYYSDLQPGDRYTFSRIRRKNTLLSQKSKKGISQRSLLPEIAAVWAGLSEADITAWKNAAAVSNLTGWRLFVQDYCARRVQVLPGIATPSLLHQSWVGQIHVEAPATAARIVQMHPHYYYVMKKVLGTKSMYSPTLVEEDLYLPLQIALSYNSNLAAAGPDPYVTFYAEVWYSYQGQNLKHYLEIELDLVSDWKEVTATLSLLESIVVRYDLHIELHDVQGDLYFDNVKAIHGGVNWVRDWTCKDINQGFTRNYYQIPKNWAAEIAPEGVQFESVYKDF
jgi:hypothetical protein